jgi:hypothetical protein
MRSVRLHTITIAEDIPEERYDYRSGPESRSLQEILMHIASITQFDWRVHGEDSLDSLEGFDFLGLFASLPIHEKLALSKPEILALLGEEGERWSGFVERLPRERHRRDNPGTGGRRKAVSRCGSAPRSTRCTIATSLMVVERLLDIVPHLTRNRQRAAAEGQQRQAAG